MLDRVKKRLQEGGWVKIFAGILVFNILVGGYLLLAFLMERREALSLSSGVMPLQVTQTVNATTNHFLRISAGPPGETLFAVAGGIAAGVSRPFGASSCTESGICGVPGLIAVAQSSAGSVDDMNNMRNDLTDSIFVTTDIAYSAYRAAGVFRHRPPYEDFRVIALLNPVYLHMVVHADSEIMTLRDLGGKRIAMGSEGSSQLRISRILLQVVGLEAGDYVEVTHRSGQALEAFENGSVDAVFEFGTPPVNALQLLAERQPLRFIDIDQESLRAFKSLYPFIEISKIPMQTYNEQTSDAPTIALDVVWLVNKELPNQLVHDIVKSLWHGQIQAIYHAMNPAVPPPVPEMIAKIDILPLHPGAEAFYRKMDNAQ